MRGFKLIEWDGEMAIVLVDKDGCLNVLLAGRPRNDPTWPHDIKDAVQSLADVKRGVLATRGNLHHHRGHYVYLGIGVSFGGGQTFPSNL